jgi:L-serine deaminase
MARIDKVTQVVRATAGSAIAIATIKGVTLNAGGSVVFCGSADAIGVICNPGTPAAGDPVGVLVRGEIVEFGGIAGVKYYAAKDTGVIGTAAAADSTYVGTTIEAGRLVVLM